jgi:diguanylate cyclase (GGDEF)-like protein
MDTLSFPEQQMDDEKTQSFSYHDACVFLYCPRDRDIVHGGIDTLVDICDIVRVNRLGELRGLTDRYRQSVLVCPDVFGHREAALRAIRARFPYLPVIIVSRDASGPAMFLEEGLIDAILSDTEDGTLCRSVIVNLQERCESTRRLMEENAELNERSVTDSLTGLFNHGYLLGVLDREFKRAERFHEQLACVMLDIDHFKAINDTYGHRFGDFILCEISNILRRTIRQTDIIGRYGGEEFMVILPATDHGGAIHLSEKIRSAIESHAFRSGEIQTIATASLGVASNRDRGVLSSEHLLMLSDRALYFAKESGRNRVCSAHEHGSLSDFDVLRRSFVVTEDHAPVLLLLTQDETLRKAVGGVADRERFQLVSFENKNDFFAEFEAFNPNVLLVDSARSLYGLEYLRQLSGRARHLHVPVVVIANDRALQLEPRIGDIADDIVFEDFRPAELSGKLQLILKVESIEKDLRHLTADLKITQKRMIKNERLRSVGEMASGMVHDFNNVLSAILGTVDILASRTDLPSDTREDLENLQASASEGLHSVQRLQSFLAPTDPDEQGRQCLSQLIRDALQLTRARWKDEAQVWSSGYVVLNTVPEDFPVFGNATELKELFVNLILNAVDAMPDGGTLSFVAEDTGPFVRVSVSDTGCGMNPETLRQVYDPFFTTKSDRSSGLGMHLVYSIIKRHGGRIELESTPGRGTRVHLFFPSLDGTDSDITTNLKGLGIPEAVAQPKTHVENSDVAPAADRRLHFLLVDDERVVREVYGRMLANLGHEVDTAHDGAEASTLINTNRYDAVITDISMPEVSGWEFARHVRKTVPDVAVVLLSGWGKSFSSELLESCGVRHVLSKPVKPAEFKELARMIASEPTNNAG